MAKKVDLSKYSFKVPIKILNNYLPLLMKNCTKYSIFALAAMACGAAFAGTSYRIGTEEADWSEESIWDPAPPTSADTATLDNGATTDFTVSATVNSVAIKEDSVLNVSSGTLRTNSDFFQTQAAVNIYGSGEVLVGAQYQFGESPTATDSGALNVYGSGSLRTTNISNSIRIGYNAEYYDVEANFYGDSTISGRIKIGSETAGSYAYTTVNVYGNSVITADYVNLYQNATLNVSDSAQINASNDLRWGDMTSDTANAVNIKDSASVKARAGVIFDGATVTVSDSASFITTGPLETTSNLGLGLGLNWSKASSGTGHLILADSATFRVSQNLIMMNNSTLTIIGSHLQMAEGQSAHLQALGGGGISNQSGTIRFVSDADGISTLVARYHAYVDTSKNTGFALELDFSNLDLAESGTYTYSIITLTENASREREIIQNYELYADDLISVIKASELDSYSIYADGLTLKIDYDFVVIPEPSTYAMSFGALALAFAAYRRRK